MTTIKLHKDYLKNELDLPSNALLDEVTDMSRWSIHHRIVFKHDNKFYETYYSEGATEMQDERPWEYEDEVECDEVELKEVKVLKWVKV
ncbi:hypothetical protein MHB40_14500 [Lysinibacillus sp. FSL K6-0057]|uniref:hypothetical protein n=1 Tax=unclassified Lysinibacillus TaxID=2636778 RepID=UPI0024814CB8|nr:hypothetical protein [Lysinibacillus sp. 1 U-2021]WGT37755.1 hypothetical protein QH639_18215 [Lysinibacillus sp. 1 U-2021]